MRYFVTLGSRTVEVDLHASGARVDGREVEAELREVPGTRVRHLLADGVSTAMVASRSTSARDLAGWRLRVAQESRLRPQGAAI